MSKSCNQYFKIYHVDNDNIMSYYNKNMQKLFASYSESQQIILDSISSLGLFPETNNHKILQEL